MGVFLSTRPSILSMPVFQISVQKKPEEEKPPSPKVVKSNLRELGQQMRAMDKVAEILGKIPFETSDREGLMVFTFRLTDSSPPLELIVNPAKLPKEGQTLLVHVHNSEMSAKEMGEEYVRQNGGALLSFSDDGKRLKEIGGELVDPNQIFNPSVPDHGHAFSGGFNPGGIARVQQFANAYGSLIERLDPDGIVALHNSGSDCFFVYDERTAKELQGFHRKHGLRAPLYYLQDGRASNPEPPRNPSDANMIFVTGQDEDPGLSHWAFLHGLPYVNVETGDDSRGDDMARRYRPKTVLDVLPDPIRIQIAKETVESLAQNGMKK